MATGAVRHQPTKTVRRSAGAPKTGAGARRRTATAPARNGAPASMSARVRKVLASLEALSTKRDRENMARFGIVAPRFFGVSIAHLQKLAKSLGRDHDLAEALWDTGWYEARLLAAFVGEPDRVTPAQMDRWCRDFDNWGVCDTLCFHLFDKTPHAWAKVAQWGDRREEFIKRAAFALLASLAGHDKTAKDAAFLATLPLIERASADDRNFVKKGMSWALRGMGHRNATLHSAAVQLAEGLAQSTEPAARWVGKDALRDLNRPAVRARLARRHSASK